MTARNEVVLAFARRTTTGVLPRVDVPAGATLFTNVRGEPDALVVAEPDVSRSELTRALARSLSLTSVVRCRSIGALPVPSTPRTTRGLLVGATDCGDDAALAEFHEFYDRVHAREVLDSGFYWRARRFERIEGDASQARFFALYDSELAGTDAYRALRRHPMTTDWPKCFLVRGVWSFDVSEHAADA